MPLTLDSIPVEIIHRIASHGPCESALALTRVSRSLYRACNDRQVFKAILRNRNGYGGSNWDVVPLSNDYPISSWARYALADSIAREWAAGNQVDRDEVPRSFAAWLPQLMCSSHPLLHSTNPATLYSAYEDAAGDDAYALALCLTLTMMSHPRRESRFSALHQDQTAWDNTQEKLREILHDGFPTIKDGVRATIRTDRNQYRMDRKQCARAVLAVGIMFEFLHQIGYTDDFDIIPTTGDIDFHAAMTLPLPFPPHAPAAMTSWHLPKMTSPAFLEDGKWTGFYQNSLGCRSQIKWDPPMRDIHFSARTNPRIPGRVDLNGNGTDFVGPFWLYGSVNSDNGVCSMTKEYREHHRWHWDGFMTPFGLVGTWGHSGCGGWFWLWKDAWRPAQFWSAKFRLYYTL